MVNMIKWIDELNEIFGPNTDPIESFPASDKSLADALEELGAGQLSTQTDLLGAFPPGHAAALRGLLEYAQRTEDSDANPKIAVTFAWMPGYDHELTITEVNAGDGPCGITVLIRGPHANDPRLVAD
jgi:hypothetical protein